MKWLKIADGFVLERAMLVLNFRFIFLSTNRLCEQIGYSVKCTENSCLMHAPSVRRPLAIGRDCIGLYILGKGVQNVHLKEEIK